MKIGRKRFSPLRPTLYYYIEDLIYADYCSAISKFLNSQVAADLSAAAH